MQMLFFVQLYLRLKHTKICIFPENKLETGTHLITDYFYTTWLFSMSLSQDKSAMFLHRTLFVIAELCF